MSNTIYQTMRSRDRLSSKRRVERLLLLSSGSTVFLGRDRLFSKRRIERQPLSMWLNLAWSRDRLFSKRRIESFVHPH
ncbi:hypothetical protein [Stenomitos frigidus]|uniref:hypothetical protein n=1 Tax=Stenomitos frigidus TaxID=1886765 RepID=UPI0011B275EB|nr:hypothetical protein [Stenomitos frigidus]